ncbi:MAG: hypothetical protein A7316_01905 [Candidatus Altiarchaeales archaeon WOR_SM1_86-2]|nr:MAG: hypothetical protein A7315_14775 [Candidatus Altiarchaeales archaeon WOR_SM1_79]ODS37299.1 MAG: hypothetical protein A7316_01905 [Candidatus Altiarchaeales archaeon WOR_SM1_86-2]
MSYSIRYHPNVKKYVGKLNKKDRTRIEKRIEILREDPYPTDTKFIKSKRYKNLKIFRIRCGKFRILYYVRHEKLIVVIVEIDKRERVY